MKNGFAEKVLLAELTTDLLYKGILQVVENQKYAVKAKTASQLVRDQKEAPLERAVWWIEWILRNPNTDHFKNITKDMNFIQLQALDIIFVIICIFLLFIWVVFKSLLAIYKLLYKRLNTKDNKNLSEKKRK